MEGKVNYTAVGIFVVILTALLFVMVFWLTSYTGQKKYKSYLVYVHEDVTGLSVDSPVRFNGVEVGFVKSIHLDGHNPKLVRLTLDVEENVRITTTTYAMLNAQGITGVIYVNLKASTVEAPLLSPPPGEKLPVIPAKPSLLMQLSTVLPEVTKDIQKLSSSISKLLDQPNRESIGNSLKNVENFTQGLSDNTKLIEANLHELHRALKNVANGTKELPQTMRSVRNVSEEMGRAAKNISHTMKKSRLAIDNFSNQVLPHAEQALAGIHAVTVNVDQFLNQLHQNPSILVRGKQPAEPGPGE